MSSRTQRTLLEQLKITDNEIQRRKALFGIRDAEFAFLRDYQALIEEVAEGVIERFFAVAGEVEEVELMIGDADTLRRLHHALRQYLLDLAGGVYDDEYVNSRLRLGMIHRRIGMRPDLYLSAVLLLKAELFDALAAAEVEDGARRHLLTSIERLLWFDTAMVFDAYVEVLGEEIVAAKRRAEEYAANLEVEVSQRTQQLQDQARHDSLTGLCNRRGLDELLRRELARAKRARKVLTVVYWDVDDFKGINDREGHFHGDEVLRQVAAALRGSVREVDLACRLGGDEFCLVLPDCSAAQARRVCQAVTDHLARAMPGLGVSHGIAETGPDGFLSAEELLRVADQRMYERKADREDRMG